MFRVAVSPFVSTPCPPSNPVFITLPTPRSTKLPPPPAPVRLPSRVFPSFPALSPAKQNWVPLCPTPYCLPFAVFLLWPYFRTFTLCPLPLNSRDSAASVYLFYFLSVPCSDCPRSFQPCASYYFPYPFEGFFMCSGPCAGCTCFASCATPVLCVSRRVHVMDCGFVRLVFRLSLKHAFASQLLCPPFARTPVSPLRPFHHRWSGVRLSHQSFRSALCSRRAPLPSVK